MNFLFTFLLHLEEPLREKLDPLSPKGTTGAVWLLINEQVTKGLFDKKEILNQTGISTSHLDKITSELLAKCYQLLFDDVYALLHFLSNRVVFIKQFYNELSRQAKNLAKTGTKEQQADFITRSFRMIHTNMPIAYRDEKTSIKLTKQYIALFKGAKKKEAEFHMGCKLLFEKMEVLFAAAEIKDKETIVEREFAALGSPLVGFSEDVLFDYYWLWIYFNHALENFSKALEIAQGALEALRTLQSAGNEINIVRIELKINEFLYYLSRFEEAHKSYQRIIYSPILESLPDRSYHITKYIQLSLITGDIAEAGKILNDKLHQMGDRVEQLIIVRDIVTYVKYCLFKEDYSTAFRFIQLGFEKNPKGKYFQYELELRNLQTAYFFLSRQEDVAIDLCQKHTKFLRNHGYTITTSSYPHFFLLTRAIFEKKTGKVNMSSRHQKMLDRYQHGSYAVYGRLLLKMLNN